MYTLHTDEEPYLLVASGNRILKVNLNSDISVGINSLISSPLLSSPHSPHLSSPFSPSSALRYQHKRYDEYTIPGCKYCRTTCLLRGFTK